VYTNGIYYEDVKIGDEWPLLMKKPITREQLVRYAGASGDFNAIHFSESAAKKAGLDDVIAQGALLMGFIGQAITNVIQNRFLRQFKVRFVSTAKIGDTITVRGKIISKDIENSEKIIRCEVTALDQKGVVKVTGMFKAALPSRN
jgi:acyl dehydratase